MTSPKFPEAGPQHFDKNDPREIFGWKMYDWANSAYFTTVITAVYLTRIYYDYRANSRKLARVSV